MSFFQDIKIGFLSGLAARKFTQQRYQEAIDLFERICELEPQGQKSMSIYVYLGRSYVYLKKYKKAIDAFTIADEIFNHNHKKSYEEISTDMEFLSAYRYALYELNQIDKFNDIERRIKKNEEK